LINKKTMINKLCLALALFICTIGAKTQNLSFNFPFIKENAKPELFFLDPNYDKENKISYYSFGDILKVQYEYDNPHNPLKKTLYKLDKYDREWEKMLVTEFLYRENRLIREDAVFYYGNSPVYRLTKSISYNKTQNTDTIRTSIKWFNDRYKNQMGIYIDNGYTIRYLNQFNQPDSTLHIISDKMYSSFYKQYFTYNNKNQLTHCRQLSKHQTNEESGEPIVEEKEWGERYRYHINYNDNKTEYVHISVEPDYENYDEYQYFGGANNYKTKEITSVYTLITDNNNRVISKLLKSDNQTILKSNYTYNAEGRASADTQLHLDKKFMSSFGLGIGQSIQGLLKEFEDMKFTSAYKDNCKNSVIYIHNKKVMEMNHCFSPDNNQLLLFEMIRFEDGELDDHEKDEYRYLANGMTEKITSRSYHEDGSIEPYRKYLYRKDSEARTIYMEEFSYDNEHKQWIPYQKEVNEYDQYGYNSLQERYEYDKPAYDYDDYLNPHNKEQIKDWQGKSWTSWANDADNRTLEEINKIWRKGQWVNQEKSRYAYDDKNRKLLSEFYKWNDKSNTWEGIRRDSSYFNDTKNIQGEIYYKWQIDKKKWIPSSKKETVTEDLKENYQSGFYRKEKKTSYKWIENQWQPLGLRIDNAGTRSSFYSYSEWDNEKQEWRTEEIEQKDENGVKTVEKYSWDEELKQLTGIYNTETIPLNKENYSARTIYRIWDFDLKNWKDTVARNMIIIDPDIVYIYEKYNDKNRKWLYEKKVEFIDRIKDQEIFIQSVWDGNGWAPDSKCIDYKKNGKIIKTEVYAYPDSDKKWKPLYCLIETEEKGETSYKKWDEQKYTWVNYLATKGSGWYTDYYLWDGQQKKYIKKDSEIIKGILKPIKAEFEKINVEDSYYRLTGR